MADSGSSPVRPRVLAVVPARGGSKGVPRKNLRLLAGKPLVAHAVAAGLAANLVDRVVCSTDDLEIAEVARAAGADVPFLRPAELAQDTSEDLPVFVHALAWLEREEGWVPDLIVNLRPTSPLRRPSHLDAAIRLLRDTGADSVKSVCLARQHPHKMWRLGADRGLEPFLTTALRQERGPDVPRAELDDVYWQNGVVDVTRRTVIVDQRLMIGRRVAGLVTDPADSIDVDTPLDLALAELILSQRPPAEPSAQLGHATLARRSVRQGPLARPASSAPDEPSAPPGPAARRCWSGPAERSGPEPGER